MDVIFRKYNKKDGAVFALFPTIPAHVSNPNIIQSYEHIGQHSGADISITQKTKLTTESEYAELLNELKGIGYFDLNVVKRITPKHREAVKKEIEIWRAK